MLSFHLTLEGFAVFASAFALVVAMPGPAVFAVIGQALTARTSALMAFIFGIVAGDIIWFTSAVFGLVFIIERFSLAFFALRWLGAAYLLYLAVSFWRTQSLLTLDADVREKAQVRVSRAFLSGLLLCLGNPKAMVFFLVLMPSAVPVASLSLLDAGALLLVIVSVLSTILAAYALLALGSRKANMRGAPHITRHFGKAAALVLALAALMVVMA